MVLQSGYAQKQPTNRNVFCLHPEQEKVLQLLGSEGDMHINLIALRLSIPIQQLSTLLFELEMNGSVKSIPGNVYRLND